MKDEKEAGSTPSIRRMSRVLAVPRVAYYRHGEEAPDNADTELRKEIEGILQKMPRYGYRRITARLKQDGHEINHKRVQRIMREGNLIQRRKGKGRLTTNSRHQMAVYENLGRDFQPTGINQLWCADTTYVYYDMGRVVYLAAVLDAYSRFCVGFAVGKRNDTSLVTKALQKALDDRKPPPGLIHHSDRGSTYASSEYINLLKQHGIWISMSRKGNPYDNSFVESFFRTVKLDEITLNNYKDYLDISVCIADYIGIYNRERLHSSLGNHSPLDFEQSLLTINPHTPLQLVSS
jgi:transposase InsO family protein